MNKIIVRIVGVCLAICGAVPFIGIIAIFLFHPLSLTKGVPDELNWLSLLSAVVGVIGAIGGIVVGVISIITLSQIETQVTAQFERKYGDHKRDLEGQYLQWASGINLWTRATMSTNSDEAAKLMEQALKLWPAVPGARTEILNRYYEETEQAYLLDLVPDRRSQLEHNRIFPSHVVEIHYSSTWEPLPSFYIHEVIRWWTLATEYEGEDNTINLDFIGSKVFAMTHNFDKMMSYLKRLSDQQQLKIRYDDLCIWYSAADTVGQIQQLDRLLLKNKSFSLNISEVMELLKTQYTANQMPVYRYFLVFNNENHVFIRRTVLKLAYHNSWTVKFYDTNDNEHQIIESDQEIEKKCGNLSFIGPLPDGWK